MTKSRAERIPDCNYRISILMDCRLRWSLAERSRERRPRTYYRRAAIGHRDGPRSSRVPPCRELHVHFRDLVIRRGFMSVVVPWPGVRAPPYHRSQQRVHGGIVGDDDIVVVGCYRSILDGAYARLIAAVRHREVEHVASEHQSADLGTRRAVARPIQPRRSRRQLPRVREKRVAVHRIRPGAVQLCRVPRAKALLRPRVTCGWIDRRRRVTHQAPAEIEPMAARIL